jgi:hypothetical protein
MQNLVTSIIDPYSQKTPYAVKQSAGMLGGLDEEVEGASHFCSQARNWS